VGGDKVPINKKAVKAIDPNNHISNVTKESVSWIYCPNNLSFEEILRI
jgi:hypothetical protein